MLELCEICVRVRSYVEFIYLFMIHILSFVYIFILIYEEIVCMFIARIDSCFSRVQCTHYISILCMITLNNVVINAIGYDVHDAK